MIKINFILLLFSCLLALVGCSSIKDQLLPTYNNGRYTIETTNSKSDSSSMVTISGTFFDIKTKKPITNFPALTLKYGCNQAQITDQSTFSFKVDNSIRDDYFYIRAIGFMYYTIETNFIDIYNKNEIKIDFYLAEYDIPFLDCPPPGMKIKE
jgi:hypothetical protein